jgi:endonuclease-3
MTIYCFQQGEEGMTKDRATKILAILKSVFPMPTWSFSARNPFQTLIITIISQNTNSKNAGKAFERLSEKHQITPEALANADVKEVKEALRIAGLYRNKTETIRKVSKIVLREFNGSLDFIYSLPLEDARKSLMSLPGVGPKTADVVLLFSARKYTIPVDTHVNRVSKRLGLAPEGGGYDEVRTALQSLFVPEDYLAVHVLLIALGRRYCRALKPLCMQCPVNELCPSKRVED